MKRDTGKLAKRCVQLGADVINMSLGTDDEALEPNAPKPHNEAIAYAAARGCVLVAASVNSGDPRTYWPAAYPEVIAVGSVGPDNKVSQFSTSGPHVSVSAPIKCPWTGLHHRTQFNVWR